MTPLKRPLCWLTKHHWLLFCEKPLTYYEDNGFPCESAYIYECRRCGDFNKTLVTDLDNMYKEGGIK